MCDNVRSSEGMSVDLLLVKSVLIYFIQNNVFTMYRQKFASVETIFNIGL